MENKIVLGNQVYLEQTLSIHTESRNEQYYRIYKQETNEYVGNCGLRLSIIQDIQYLGNVEYEIFKEFRRCGYAKEATILLGNIAYDLGAHSLQITANIKNGPSLYLIQSLGAEFIKVVKVPKRCRLYKQGDRFLAVYDCKIEKRSQL